MCFAIDFEISIFLCLLSQWKKLAELFWMHIFCAVTIGVGAIIVKCKYCLMHSNTQSSCNFNEFLKLHARKKFSIITSHQRIFSLCWLISRMSDGVNAKWSSVDDILPSFSLRFFFRVFMLNCDFQLKVFLDFHRASCVFNDFICRRRGKKDETI